MAQVGPVEPAGVAKLSGRGRRRRVIGHTVATLPHRTETRIVANSSSAQPRSTSTPADLAGDDCGLCELKPPGAWGTIMKRA